MNKGPFSNTDAFFNHETYNVPQMHGKRTTKYVIDTPFFIL